MIYTSNIFRCLQEHSGVLERKGEILGRMDPHQFANLAEDLL